MSKNITTAIGIVSFAGLGIFALASGTDGAILALIISAISGVLGYNIAKKP